MVYVDGRGIATPLYLTDLQDPETGKIPPRLVDITSEEVQNVFKYETHYIKPEDYEAAKKYLANPEEYDFYKILNWEYPQD
jgi:6-phosphofructokinase 1